MVAIRLWGAYTYGPNNTWNAQGSNPTVNNNWYLGMQSFGTFTGLMPNSTDVFPSWGGTSMKAWPGQCRDSLKGIALKFDPTQFVPMISSKMVSKSPALDAADGTAYKWDSASAYNEIAAGRWDATWEGYVQGAYDFGFNIVYFRLAYEANMTYMEDSLNWDAPTQAAWRAAMYHALAVMRAKANTLKAIRPSFDWRQGPCAVQGWSTISVRAMYEGSSADLSLVDEMFFDCYQQNWSPNASDPAHPENDIIVWDQQSGGNFGFNAARALAVQYGKGIFWAESGTGQAPQGAAHGLLDDATWIVNQRAEANKIRAAGIPFRGMILWNINASDGTLRFTDGTQPNVLAAVQAAVASGDLIGDPLDSIVTGGGGGDTTGGGGGGDTTGGGSSGSTNVLGLDQIPNQIAGIPFSITVKANYALTPANIEFTSASSGPQWGGVTANSGYSISSDGTQITIVLTQNTIAPHTIQFRDNSQSPVLYSSPSTYDLVHPSLVATDPGPQRVSVPYQVLVTANYVMVAANLQYKNADGASFAPISALQNGYDLEPSQDGRTSSITVFLQNSVADSTTPFQLQDTKYSGLSNALSYSVTSVTSQLTQRFLATNTGRPILFGKQPLHIG